METKFALLDGILNDGDGGGGDGDGERIENSTEAYVGGGSGISCYHSS